MVKLVSWGLGLSKLCLSQLLLLEHEIMAPNRGNYCEWQALGTALESTSLGSFSVLLLSRLWSVRLIASSVFDR